jgi:hypothetical protein
MNNISEIIDKMRNSDEFGDWCKYNNKDDEDNELSLIFDSFPDKPFNYSNLSNNPNTTLKMIFFRHFSRVIIDLSL